MKIRFFILLLFVFFVFMQVATAQQIWLQPDTFLVNRKQTVNLQLVSGDSLQPAGNANQAQVLRFTLFDKKDSLNLTSNFTGTTISLSGSQVSNRTLAVGRLRLPTADLLHHLYRHEFTREQKAMLKSIDTMVLRTNIPTEHLVFVKALLSDGSKSGGEVHQKMVDLPLEIMLLLDPFSLTPGNVLPVQIIFDRKVMAFKTFTVWHQDLKGNVKKYTAKTNKAGVGKFVVKGAGQYLVSVSQTGPLPTPNPEEVKWQQLEATYTFYLPAPPKKK